MRLVVATDEGTIAINYVWLPTWIGMNNVLLTELGEKLMGEFKNMPITDEVLCEMDYRAKMFLIERLSMPSLRHLLDALEKVEP